ncbi:uncharacterized protein LOC135808954 isoform X2 [Sycon ciliatum]|uniref:uncharacterized protein LOC135808954 isoform X2 n=1 Tax=Sycon ciliatum TaxID=27933 RepID=UPI0031F5F6A0
MCLWTPISSTRKPETTCQVLRSCSHLNFPTFAIIAYAMGKIKVKVKALKLLLTAVLLPLIEATTMSASSTCPHANDIVLRSDMERFISNKKLSPRINLSQCGCHYGMLCVCGPDACKGSCPEQCTGRCPPDRPFPRYTDRSQGEACRAIDLFNHTDAQCSSCCGPLDCAEDEYQFMCLCLPKSVRPRSLDNLTESPFSSPGETHVTSFGMLSWIPPTAKPPVASEPPSTLPNGRSVTNVPAIAILCTLLAVFAAVGCTVCVVRHWCRKPRDPMSKHHNIVPPKPSCAYDRHGNLIFVRPTALPRFFTCDAAADDSTLECILAEIGAERHRLSTSQESLTPHEHTRTRRPSLAWL